MEPVNLESSTPPKVSSPLVSSSSDPLNGAKETPRMFSLMTPLEGKNGQPFKLKLRRRRAYCDTRFCINVGTVLTPLTVSSVRSTGPNPTIPSVPSKPLDVFATPMDWPVTPVPPRETVSVNSVPLNHKSDSGYRIKSKYTHEKLPEPYETSTESPLLFPVDPATNLVVAPTHVLEEPYVRKVKENDR